MRRIAAAGLGVALLAVLTACNPVTSSYAIFNTDATAEDALPED